jgi:DNA-binding Lrp family transcriptional regulator
VNRVLDFQIIHALQIQPRVSWAALGTILNVDASTLSRRWNRLVADGLVWTTCQYREEYSRLGAPSVALVEVVCSPGRREEVIAEFVRMPRLVSVHCTSGSRDLYLTMWGTDVLDVACFVDEQVLTVPGVVASQTHHVRRLFQNGSAWRLRSLDRDQVRALTDMLPLPSGGQVPTAADLRILQALQADTRRPVSDVQREVGRSLASVSRAIDRLQAVDWARWRVDFAHQLLGWRASAMLWMSVRHSELDSVAAVCRLMPQVRLCASVTGVANLTASLWLREISDLDEIEGKLTTVFPNLQITDRWMVPRVAKRTGHILDRDGRKVEYVPGALPADS